MTADQEVRMRRLRAVEARLAQLPRSRERERLLREVRSRVVALETGADDDAAWRPGAEPDDGRVSLARDLSAASTR